jgi:hypothetical protein
MAIITRHRSPSDKAPVATIGCTGLLPSRTPAHLVDARLCRTTTPKVIPQSTNLALGSGKVIIHSTFSDHRPFTESALE